MKKFYILFVAVMVTSFVNAQGTNLDFETWPDAETCTGWTVASAEDSISQVTTPIPAIEGTSSMLIANTMFTDGNGADSLGGSWVEQAIQVVADSVYVSVMPTMMGTDTARVGLVLFNGTSPVVSVVSEFAVADNPPLGQYYTINFDLTDGQIPTYDAMVIYFYSSRTPNNAGSFIVVDDVRIFEPSGVGVEENTLADILAYPNPATTEINFNIGDNDVDFIQIVDISGRIVENVAVNSSIESVSVEDFQNGVYFYQIIDNDKVVKTDKFVVSK